MKKNLWLVLLALASAFCLCFGLAACGKVKEHIHTFTNYVYNNDATCTEDGTETARCDYSGCKETVTRTAVGSKLGHNMELHMGSVTCTEAGTLDYWRCMRCKKDFIDKDGSAEMTEYESNVPLGHKFTVENRCSVCGTEWHYTDGLYYLLDPKTDTYTVTGIETEVSTIVIPYGHDGKKVTAIGADAFDNCADLVNITIPDSVTLIGARAFEYCTGLTNITIPNSVTSIESGAFGHCTGLTSITIPDSVTSIGSSAFYKCTELASIEIPDGVTSIGLNAFVGTAYYNDKSHWDGDGAVLYIGNHLIKANVFDSRDFREGTKTIAAGAFIDCILSPYITLPNSITTIGAAAFDHSNLKSITIPESVTSIGSAAFESCSNLKSVIFDGNSQIKTIPHAVFNECQNLEDITIPEGVTLIASYAFASCSKLSSVIIPKSVISIGSTAFNRCTGLTSITILEGVTTIGDDAFARCTALTDIKLPESVTSIGDYVFDGCNELKSVTIGSGVTSIGDYAFVGCRALTDIQFKETTAEWQVVEKGTDWNMNTGDYIITCTDGTITKDGIVTMN